MVEPTRGPDRRVQRSFISSRVRLCPTLTAPRSLAQLEEACVRVFGEVTLREQPQAHELLVVRLEVREVALRTATAMTPLPARHEGLRRNHAPLHARIPEQQLVAGDQYQV